MILKGKRNILVLVLWLVAASLSAALPTVSGHCETLRFIFMADSRGNNDSDDLINTAALKAINDQILALSPRPSFVIFGGDQARRGYCHPHGRGEYTFKKFKDVMKPLTDAGIKLYAVMGNHELYREGGDVENELVGDFYIDNQREFQKEFTDNSRNGPAEYERLVYSFESPGGDAFFGVLDCYYLKQDSPSTDLFGHFDDTQLTWLEDKLKNTKATHKFVFAHAPYYQIFGDQYKQNTTFTKLWSILDKYRIDFYGCGHTHLYSRKNINGSISPDPQLNPPVQWKNNVTQLLNGTCGAHTSTEDPSVNRYTWHVFNAEDNHFFTVVDIKDKIATVTSYGGAASPYTIIDRFTIPGGNNPSIDLMLLD